ncbi:MAG: enoyl-CoA hydratase [Parvibaculaceae bacterium]|jgi:enoyl-CoA hydratase|nr:crotonase/enoyl-CoA hydratase family protein [Parvibaculaceae bacterium]
MSLAESQSPNADSPQTAYRCFDVEIKNNIAHVVLKRADELNTMVKEFWSELPEIITDIDTNARARVIVISSTGRHFTAGMDVSVFAKKESKVKRELGRVRAGFITTVKQLQESFNCIDRARIPVLMAVQGGCIGGGVDFASACDVRYATKDAFFTIYETKIGMTADVGTFPRLPNLMPQGLVRELAYTGRRMYADEANTQGFVTKVFENQEEMLAGVMAIAEEIAENSPLAVQGCKEMINYARDHSIDDGLDYIAVWQTGMFQTADMAEAFGAKAENRKAEYDDLLPVPKPFTVPE